MKNILRFEILVSILAIGCTNVPPRATSPEEPVTETPSTTFVEPKAQTIPSVDEAFEEPSGDSQQTLSREALRQFLAAGPAAILAMVDTKPVFKGGTFVGFRITAFHCEPPVAVDLHVGDVLVSINEIIVERPEQFYEVIETLKAAASLKIVVIRDQSKLELQYPIEG